MARQVSYETVSEPRRVRVTAYACDGCGGEISPGDIDETFANELVITLNQDECVSFFRRRDYCTACLEPIWQAVSKLIKADPDTEGDDREDDD